MKIVLSRKGFDSGYGGCASPIFPDDSMASFPIPDARETKHSMNGMLCGGYDLGEVVQDLTRGLNPTHPIGHGSMIHLDPDLRDSRAIREPGWRQAFGQDGAAQTHLSNQQVGRDDTFLFFGWFRRVERFNGRWRFVRSEPDLHVIFGWLQVHEVLLVDAMARRDAAYRWLADHPHIRHADRFPDNNTIYIASRRLVIDGLPTALPGGGTFGRFSPLRQLTRPRDPARAPAPRRSYWQLPRWFSGSDATARPALTYHGNAARWEVEATDPTKVNLRSVAKGQEFVLDLASCPEAGQWLRQLFDFRSELD